MNTNYPPATLFGAHTRLIPSSFVNEEYELSIWLPPSYETSAQRYPTLYVMDSPFAFGSAAEGALITSADVDAVPEMIVVGIGKQMEDREEWGTIRYRDYSPVPLPPPGSGQADAYLNFLEQECLPFIDTNYRTQPDDRLIFGNSLGGFFAVYTLFNKTHLFSRYIASVPSFVLWGTRLFDYEPALAAESLPHEARLFVSVGSLDHRYAPQVFPFMEALTNRKLPNLKFQTLVIEGLGHMTAAMPALYYGLEAVYTM